MDNWPEQEKTANHESIFKQARLEKLKKKKEKVNKQTETPNPTDRATEDSAL